MVDGKNYGSLMISFCCLLSRISPHYFGAAVTSPLLDLGCLSYDSQHPDRAGNPSDLSRISGSQMADRQDVLVTRKGERIVFVVFVGVQCKHLAPEQSEWGSGGHAIDR